jgi:hypothetical protein
MINPAVMKTFIALSVLTLTLVTATTQSEAQSILGTWQLVKQSKCIDDEISAGTQAEQELVADMKSQSGAQQQIVRFREKGQGEESTRILTKKKSANSKNFLYKQNGETLLILDKKSQTIAETWSIDKLTTDSLILSNTARSCDIQIFLKIKEPK